MLLQFVALVPAFTVHEWAHAFVAHRLGDPTPRWQGRLTLNPLRHVDWIGLILLFAFGFGWARPVPVNPGYFANPRRGLLFVALAGPLANLLMAYLAIAALPWAAQLPSPAAGLAQVFAWMFVSLNVGLAVFNLIPIPPLDGSKILAGLLPERQAWNLQRMEPYGWLLLMLLLGSGIGQAPLASARMWLTRALVLLASWTLQLGAGIGR